MRLVWLGNATWAPSGYGEQGHLFVPRLQALGHTMAVAANYGLQGTRLEWHGLTVYPTDGHWGNRAIGAYAEHHRADAVICLHDAWVMKPDEWPPELRMAIWAPVDHYPLPPAVLAVLQHEQVVPIAMSRFGEEQMQRFDLDPLYVPHAIDTGMFRPQPEIRDVVRDELDIPRDAFLVGMVAANKGNPAFPRKGFPQAFDAFARFARQHKDAWMYVHTDAMPSGGGIDLDKMARALHVVQGLPLDRVRFPPPKIWHLGLPREVMGNLYAAFDVLLNPSMGEGFGIPILEAQACGVPVIASNHSAMTELTQAGWLVDGDPWWDALQESFAFVPAIGSIVQALEASYEARGDERLRRAAAVWGQAYDADVVTDTYWRPALAELERRVGPAEVPPLNGNRAQRRRAAKVKSKATA